MNQQQRDDAAWQLALSAMSGENECLDTPEFREVWLEWVQERTDRKKAMTPRAMKMQIRKLEGYGHEDAVKTVAASIENGWTGISRYWMRQLERDALVYSRGAERVKAKKDKYAGR